MKKQRLADIAVAAAEESVATHGPKENCEVKESKDECTLTYHGEKIETVEQLLASAGIDMRLWEISEQSVNNWEVAGKRRMGQDADRKWLADKLWKTGLRQIKVKLRRRAPKVVQDGILDLIKDFRPWKKFSTPKVADDGNYLLGIYLDDAHFGKRCWAQESGDNYDLDIAVQTFRDGFDDLLAKSMRYAKNVNRIWFPIGNDFFHVNDWQSRTGNETRVESTDDRFPKVFRAGTECVLNAIKRLSEIAPVDVIWVPGNHDPATSWHLAFLSECVFRNNPHVKVDMSLRGRKYHRYGCTLVGFCHGEKVKENKLPTLMSSEARHLIDSNVHFREWHLGHLHIARETEFRTEDSLPNTIIRRVPSLCGTDGWHDQQGFVDTYKMAEAYLWSETRGPDAKFITHASGASIAAA